MLAGICFLTSCLPCSCPAGLEGITGGAGLDLAPIEWGKCSSGTIPLPSGAQQCLKSSGGTGGGGLAPTGAPRAAGGGWLGTH